jgi:hypothetical protein
MMNGMSKRMSSGKATRSRRRILKARKTFTLSPKSVEVIERLASLRNSGGRESASAVLDDLLIAVGEEQRRQAMERSTQQYYDERSPEEEQEEIAWAKFALSQFPVRDSEGEPQ